mgnify:CR=1 FL=1
MPKTLRIKDLPISPFPGSKRKRFDALAGRKKRDCLIDPFLGGGALALLCDCPLKIVAEGDPALNLQWQFILQNRWKEVLQEMTAWQKKVSYLLSTAGYFAYCTLTPKKRRKEAVLPGNELALVFLEEMDKLWSQLLKSLKSSDDLKQAAAALAVRKLSFASYTREGKDGQLNIKWTTDKLASFVNFDGKQPIIKGEWSLHKDAFDAISAYMCQPIDNAIALIDPPYWLPPVDGVRNQLTPSYRGHKPHNPETFALGIASLRLLSSLTTVRRIAYCNYYSKPMDAAVRQTAEACSRSVELIEFGVLDQSHQGHGLQRANNLDCAWILI